MSQRELRGPAGGTPPPATAELKDGSVLHLSPLAHEISRRFLAEHPEHASHYGASGFEWCAHDNQWILAWAGEDTQIEGGHLERNITWLAGILQARSYPIAHLARDLDIAADVLSDKEPKALLLADRLRATAATLRERHA